MLVFGLLCFGAFSLMVEGQNVRYRPRPSVNRARPSRYNALYAQAMRQRSMSNQRSSPLQNFVPQSWRDLIRMNGDVHNVTDFLNLLVTSDGRPVTEDDIFSPYETADGKRVITGGGILATSDECSPRNMSVRLPLDYRDGQIAYYPECTMVQRCGGCTPTPFLSCEPRYKEKIVLKVLRARYLYPGALSMRWEGFTSVEVERHLSCRAVCNLQAEDCHEGQMFNPYQCKCMCTRFQRCSNGRLWDSENCGCRCANEGPCCAEDGQEDDRTCTSYFDRDFCECTLKTSIGVSPNASQAEIEAWLASRRNQNGQNGHTPPPTSVVPPVNTTTPTTPTPPARTTPSCGHLRCPVQFSRVVNAHGNCVCVRRGAPSRMRNGRG